ncbi:MAG: right-handed parallel beta-helix repeat-containing protein [Armatimonadota bacterium]
MTTHAWMLMLSAALTVAALGSCAAEQYYLTPDGDDGDAGTREAPWQSLEKASEAAEAGDTVILLPGDYPGQLRPTSSGTDEAPIVFRAEERMTARLTGESGEMAIVLDGLEHVRLEGLHVRPDGAGRGWLIVRNCSHVTIDDCRMIGSTGGASHIDTCEDVTVRNSAFERHTGGINMLRVSDTTRLLFEGNTISRAGHSPFQFHPDHSNSYIVIRGNVFHAAWGRSFEHFGTQHVLFEHNIVTNAFNSGWSGSANAKFATTLGIFRFNRVFRNPHGPINLYPFRDVYLDSIRLYNNVFDDNEHYGIAANSSHGQTRDLLFANNIFSRNDEYGWQRQIRLSGGTPEQVRLVSNVFATSGPEEAVVSDYGEELTVEALESEEVRDERGARYLGNMNVEPGYRDWENYDHALREDSPLRDAGCFLTAAVGAGDGTLLAVEDAAPFYDGYGIDGEQGDLVAIGTAEQRARVVEVDHEASTLRLDREVRWEDGDPVSLAWSGAAPDIGVYEHGDDGRAAAQVVVEPFEVTPGEQVTMRAVVHGDARPESVRWWLGDGKVAEGAEITHVYDEAYDYAIRAEVHNADGRIHRAPGYVRVEESVDPSEPLIHSTWGPEDDSAWWLWKSYGYPGPAGYRDVVEGGVRHGPNTRNIPAGYEPPGDGTNYRHVRAPADEGGIPARIHPVGWDIDRYPEVFVRYRLGEGTPLVVALKPFGRSALRVAINPAVESNLTPVADYVLHDDEQWHELTFDVRMVREEYPDLQVLEGLYFVRSSRSAVKEGHWYDLDEVIIRPATGE